MRARPVGSHAPAFGIVLSIVQAACSGPPPLKTYGPIGDLETRVPLDLVEGGHGEPVVPPPGIAWAARLDAFSEEPAGGLPARRFEMVLKLRDEAAPEQGWALQPLIEETLLVDDYGRRFASHRASVPAEDERTSRHDPASRDYTLVFDLPSDYVFRTVRTVTVHWALQLRDGTVLRISSRFRN